MTTFEKISDKQREYYLYQSRQNALREQKTIQISLEENKRAVIAAEKRTRQAEENIKASEQKIRQLQEMLKKKGLDPDS
ncbi:MAG: hypothetical protein HRU20_15055 [Pseudomonadales bacterium]|nr:hypothetical protein [Pseudomonadales bacterium]